MGYSKCVMVPFCCAARSLLLGHFLFQWEPLKFRSPFSKSFSKSFTLLSESYVLKWQYADKSSSPEKVQGAHLSSDAIPWDTAIVVTVSDASFAQ